MYNHLVMEIYTQRAPQQYAATLFSSLRHSHAMLLAYLIIFFHHITLFAEDNKMDAGCIATVMTPVLMRINENEMARISVYADGLAVLIRDAYALIPNSYKNPFLAEFERHYPDAQTQAAAYAPGASAAAPGPEFEQISPVPDIHSEDDIINYILKDRQLLHRPDDWSKFTFQQLMQEYVAMKTAISCYYYNTYLATQEWPDEKSCQNVLNTLDQIKHVLSVQSDSMTFSNTAMDYKVFTNERDVVLPQTTDQLASFIADLQTEMIALQHRLSALPPTTYLIQTNDVRRLAEQRLTTARLMVPPRRTDPQLCNQIDKYISSTIRSILEKIN